MKKYMFFFICLSVCLAVCITDSWAVEVKGNNPYWTHVGTVNVKQGMVIRIHASGRVNFGCRFDACNDLATAGVTGSTAASVLKVFTGQITPLRLLLPPYPIDQATQLWRVINQNFFVTRSPNYDQGGVWIKILKKNGQPYTGTQLYFWWAQSEGINKYGLPILEDVNVYAKAHDGGTNPESTKSYGDNTGSYMVSIETVFGK
jgi:hypothetical protein